MNETLLVLFVIVLFLILGVVVYFRFSLGQVERVAEELSEQEGTVLLASIQGLPEVRCGDRDCVDTSKLLAFRTVLEQSAEYGKQLFGSLTFRVKQVYPVPLSEEDCTLGLYVQDAYPGNCGVWVVYDLKPSRVEKSIVLSVPVSLYFPELEEYRIGRVEVVQYE